MVRWVLGAGILLLSGPVWAAPLPSDGDVVPPHGQQSQPQTSQPDSRSGQGAPDSGSSSGSHGLPSDGDVVPPHGGGSPSGPSSGGDQPSSGQSQQSGGAHGLPSDGDIVPPHGAGSSSSPQPQNQNGQPPGSI